MKLKTFGKNPQGEKLEKVKKSPHYKNGSFQNLSHTDVMLKESSYLKVMREFLNKPKTVSPHHIIPSIHTGLKSLKDEKPVIVWFGHSSYLIKSKGVNILVDPVFSGNASPFSIFAKAFSGANKYQVEDLPPIDILIITHDHYDHLDYKTVVQLAPNVKKIYTALGVSSHLEYWGIDSTKITELDWWEAKKVSEEIEITATPSRHFSGRSFTRGKTLWASFVLKIHGYTIFVGGDSGYDKHFKEIGDKFGPFDITMLECGQYGKDWPYIHMFPEQVVQAAQDLKTKMLLPVHWGKFVLSNHDWNDSIKRVVKAAAENNVNITTPEIGDPIILGTVYPQKTWWEF